MHMPQHRRVHYNMLTMQDFMEIMKLEIANVLNIKISNQVMDEVASTLWENTPEAVGEFYNIYQSQGHDALSDAVHQRYGKVKPLPQDAKENRYAQAMLSWFYRCSPVS